MKADRVLFFLALLVALAGCSQAAPSFAPTAALVEANAAAAAQSTVAQPIP